MNYAVVFMNVNTGKVDMDLFTEPNEGEARCSFHACYRHGDYKILSVTEVPEVVKR